MMNTFQFSLALVRGIGLYMLATACVALASESSQFIKSPPNLPLPKWGNMYLFVHWLLTGGAGLLFLWKGTFFARLLARGTYAEGHCQRCGYNLSGSDATRCPECGDSGPTGNKGPGETR